MTWRNRHILRPSAGAERSQSSRYFPLCLPSTASWKPFFTPPLFKDKCSLLSSPASHRAITAHALPSLSRWAEAVCERVSGERCGGWMDVDWGISIYSRVRSSVSCSHPPPPHCLCVHSKKIMVLLSSVCVICTTCEHSWAPFSLHLNPPLFHLCLSKLALLSPCFSVSLSPCFFPPLVSFLLSICCRIQSARSQFSKPQVGTFPPRFLSLSPNRQKKKKKKNPHSWVPFIPSLKLIEDQLLLNCGYSCERRNCGAVWLRVGRRTNSEEVFFLSSCQSEGSLSYHI